MAFFFAGWAPAAKAAEFGIVPGSFSVRMLDAEGNPEVRSGAHPSSLKIGFALETEGTGTSARDIDVEMPPGFGGDPSAVSACPRQAHEEGEECPADSQVGTVSFGSSAPLPIYLLEPEPGQVASFTSRTGLPIPFELKLRPDDFGITFEADELAEGAPNEAQIELWGMPAEHQEVPPSESRPFLTTPSVCGFVTFALRVRSQEEGAPWLSESTEVGPLAGCQDLPFRPRFGLRLSNPLADAPTGMQMTLSAEEEGGELASAQMKDATVDLPAGLTISPGGATKLAVCSDAQLGLNSSAPASCPEAARVGTVELLSGALPEPLSGTVYLGQQRGGERFRLFIVAPGFGIVFKFVSSLAPDPATGRLTATLHDLPQVALDQIVMNLDGGPTGLLATPLGCGPARGDAQFAPYGGGATVTSTTTVAIAATLPGLACPGPLPFAPKLLVATSSHRAGRASAFSATLYRRGGEGLPAQFSLTLPAGLSLALGAVEECPEALVTAHSCPPASEVGSVQAAIGSGPAPALLSGAAYLAGAYRHAPFSLAMIFPAKIGPFDLGTIALQATAGIDTGSGRVTVATDRLPSAVEGVPIRFQSIALALDRKGLVHNPTSCQPHSLDAVIQSLEGQSTTLTSPFPVSGCRGLGFDPRLRMSLLSHGRLRRNDHVGVHVGARFRSGDSAARSLTVALPPALRLGIGGLREICSRPDAQRGLCPPGSRVGNARARTPLLSRPLTGSIFVVRPRDDREPDLSISLSGDGVSLTLRGSSEKEHGRFVTKLTGLPDIPLSSFAMQLGSPAEKLLSLATAPCAGGKGQPLLAQFLAVGQNGARRNSKPQVSVNPRCGTASHR